MRRVVIFHALLWLGANNILYKDVIINYKEMANLEDEFVPRSVKDNIVLSFSDHSKHKGYTHNLSEDHLENDIHTAISDCNKLQSGLLSGYVFSDIEGTHHHPILKLISLVNNLANDDGEKTELLIVYSANGYPTCLNDWEDEHYFIGAFPMLFPFADGRHLVKHKTAISLAIRAKWAMKHHSCR